MNDYQMFLTHKAQMEGSSGFDPLWLPEFLFPFQQHLVTWAIRKGRGAILSDCGTGKGPMALVWAENMRRKSGKPTLILTPLAVSYQLQREAEKFGIDAGISRTGDLPAGIVITNYERLHYFKREDFGAVVCDESSCLKALDGSTRTMVTAFMRHIPYRLLCTATPAPNDFIELGTSSEALGYLGLMDMLSRFFVNDRKTVDTKGHWTNQGGKRGEIGWRFKGYGEDPFWRWVASWARAMRRPSDLGFSDEGFILPELIQREHVISPRSTRPGTLFSLPANGLWEEREEARRTVSERCELVAELLTDAPHAVAWCQLNVEGDELTRRIPGAVQVSGSDSADRKEEVLQAFSAGQIRVLVSKPSITGWGLNWQFCHRMTFFPSHSYEMHYQAVRRCWRFGQTEPVTVDMVTTTGSANILKNIARKTTQADRMFSTLVAHMHQAVLEVERSTAFTKRMEVPAWLIPTI